MRVCVCLCVLTCMCDRGACVVVPGECLSLGMMLELSN